LQLSFTKCVEDIRRTPWGYQALVKALLSWLG